MSTRLLSRIGLPVALSLSAIALADAPPAGEAAPSTAPSTAPGESSYEGYLAPIDPFEAKLDPRSFVGPFKIKSVVPHGTEVKAGDVLIQFDTADIDDAILAATSELEVAKAKQAKQATDNTLGEQNDAQSLAVANDSVSDAQLALEWWDKTDSPRFLMSLDLEEKQSVDAVGDQQDELDQLKKMYKSEELTSATADIVVKRAVRSLERSKVILDITKGDVARRKATEFVDKKQELDRNLFNAKQALEALKAQLELSKVERAAETAKAKAAVKDAQKKLNELEEDKAAMSIKSKIDGIAYYGSFEEGEWKGSKADALKADVKVQPAGTLLTVVAPAKLKAVVKVDESKVFEIKPGAALTIEPATIEGVKLSGKAASVDLLANEQGHYPLTVDLSGADPRLLPGMKVKASMGDGK